MLIYIYTRFICFLLKCCRQKLLCSVIGCRKTGLIHLLHPIYGIYIMLPGVLLLVCSKLEAALVLVLCRALDLLVNAVKYRTDVKFSLCCRNDEYITCDIWNSQLFYVYSSGNVNENSCIY